MKKKTDITVSALWIKIGLLSVLLLTIFFRFYNYNNRWGLAYDQAHDVLVAREAVREHKLPLLGPFSSAGPFQTGGEWYWFIMSGVVLNQNWVLSPWILLTVVSVVFVALIMYVGWLLAGIDLAIIVGLIAAFSTAQNSQATNLTNQAPLAIIALAAIWASINYIRKKSNFSVFILGFFVGLGVSIHLQGVALLTLLALTLVFTGIRGLPLAITGFILPMMPLVVYDIGHRFVNFQNMFNYYLRNPNPVSYDMLGRRWLTYLTVFWPQEWSLVTGGFLVIGIITILSVMIVVAIVALKEKLTKEIWVLLLTIISSIVLLRYVRTPIFSSYLTFLHPLILLAVGWSILRIAKSRMVIGAAILIIVLTGSFIKTWNDLSNSTNYTIIEVNRLISQLETIRPATSYKIYDNKYKEVGKSVPLSLMLDVYGKAGENGLRIGVGKGTQDLTLALLKKLIVGSPTGLWIIDLSGSSSAELVQNHWFTVDAKSIYHSTEEWSQ